MILSFSLVLAQEKAENISVYRRESRTNNTVEAYNCSLNKKIRAKGDFYAFVQILKQQEFDKYTTIRLLVDSAGGVAERHSHSRSVSKKNLYLHSFYHLLIATFSCSLSLYKTGSRQSYQNCNRRPGH